MTPDQFARSCALMGYCPRKFAEKYTTGRDELTDDDYIEVFRRYQRHLDIKSGEIERSHGLRKYYYGKFRGKTTKRYRLLGRDMAEEDNR